MTKIEMLTPSMKKKAEKMLHLLDSEKIAYKVLETLRTEAVQRAYYAQGRDALAVVNIKRRSAGLGPITDIENARKITWTLESKHIAGKAIDIVPIIDGKIPWKINSKEIADIYLRIGEIGEACGLSWGGRWKPLDKFGIGKDAPHFEEE